MPDTQDNRPKNIFESFKDSAIIITIISVVLYTWGYSFEMFGMIAKGIPIDFYQEKSIQEYIFLGGFIGLTIFFPVIALAFIIIKNINRKRLPENKINIISKLSSYDLTRQTILILLLFSMTIYVLAPLSQFIVKSNNQKRYKVKRVLLNDSSTTCNSYVDFTYLTKKGPNYILSDTMSVDHQSIIILSENNIKEIVLKRE